MSYGPQRSREEQELEVVREALDAANVRVWRTALHALVGVGVALVFMVYSKALVGKVVDVVNVNWATPSGTALFLSCVVFLHAIYAVGLWVGAIISAREVEAQMTQLKEGQSLRQRKTAEGAR